MEVSAWAPLADNSWPRLPEVCLLPQLSPAALFSAPGLLPKQMGGTFCCSDPSQEMLPPAAIRPAPGFEALGLGLSRAPVTGDLALDGGCVL